MGFLSKLFGKKKEDSKASIDVMELAKEQEKQAIVVCEDHAAPASSPRQKTIVIKTGMSEAVRAARAKEESQQTTVKPVSPAKPSAPKAKPLPAGKWPSKSNLKGISSGRTLSYRYDLAKSRFPEYNFYTSDVDEAKIETAKVRLDELYADAQKMLDEAGVAFGSQDYEKAASIYEKMVDEEYWEPEPYNRLLTIYKYANLMKAYKRLLEYSIRIFSDKRKKDREKVMEMANRYGASVWAERQISEGNRISYYDGLFDLYNPYPTVEIWRKSVAQLGSNQ